MARCYQRLSQEERDKLSLFKAEKKSLREIARLLKRSPSTVSRELRRNCPPIRKGRYLPHKAQLRALQRQVQGHKRTRMHDGRLRAYIGRQIRRGWSPERIAGRWKLLGHGKISHEAIYQWVYGYARELIHYLPRAYSTRKRHVNRGKHWLFYIPSRNPIRERPKAVETRKQAGHWEADTMIGHGQASALQILVERKTRFIRLNKLPAKLAGAMRRAINRSLGRYPRSLRRTITYDNGRENVEHLLVNRVLGTASYFCAPMHSWEKGSVENAAGLVRRRLPKKTDFAMVSVKQVKQVERWINGLPRKCLGYKTSAEAFRRSVALAP